MIDTHCHFDMMNNPEDFIRFMSENGHTIIGMTNCPEHFAAGYSIVRSYLRIRLSLGFHPHVVKEIYTQLPLFDKMEKETSFIGEIGLDFSKNFLSTKEIQLQVFEHLCQTLSHKKKIISIHSTKAETEVLSFIEKYSLKTPILHWYTGPLDLVDQAIALGCYFSINESMTLTYKGKRIISKLPPDRILTESDAPFNRHSNIERAISNVNINTSLILQNFRRLLSTLS